MISDDNFKNLHLQLSSEDIKKIDNWKIAKGMKSRSEAIRSMVRLVTDDHHVQASDMQENRKDYIAPENKSLNELTDLVKKLIKEELKNK